jgi:hypothetical protein
MRLVRGEEVFEFLKLKAKDAVSARSSMKATLRVATPTPVNDLPNRSFVVVGFDQDDPELLDSPVLFWQVDCPAMCKFLQHE